ncbi:Txe/YoeB family addiction module toxin [Elizabethkingia anophelis]|nr:Txe/YoeB family addiction module toxin [Elizabethkingia anophelis]
MAKYIIKYSNQAIKDLKEIKKSGRKIDMEKISTMIEEMAETPRKGTGHPEQLKHFDGEIWSRKINKGDRLVYEIFDEEVIIDIIKAKGHYNDK